MEQPRPPGIAAIATKYGLIQGVLAFVVFVAQVMTNLKPSWLATVADVVILIVLMVLAHGQYKRTHNGKLTYPQGLGSGTLLACVAAVVTAVLVYIYIEYLNKGYIAAAVQAQRDALAQRGITGAQAQQAMAIVGFVLTPTGIVVTSLISGVIVGFITALIVSIFTQKDPMAI